MKVHVPNQIWRLLKGRSSLEKGLADFIRCCAENTPPPRIYKASGTNIRGEVFQPYVALKLHHHHLHRDHDPLLVTQHDGDDIYVIAIANHATYFGDTMSWLKANEEAIHWDGNEDLRAAVLAYERSPKDISS